MKPARSLCASILSVTLLLWVMPLGVFIKASQEKTACGGARAFHMCSMMKAKKISTESRSSKVLISNPAQTEETSKPSTGSSGNDLLMARSALMGEEKNARFFVFNEIHLTSFLRKPIEQVPKF